MSLTCYSCSKTLDPLDFNRADRCPHCGRDTRVCRNCIHYDTSKYNECAETTADRVVDKEKSNFCDHFKPGQPTSKGAGLSAAEKAKLAAEALFKKK
ncbi:MAG TPA: hypothetical protein PLH57_07545 [Oligoflexia bacterium]|nr:hypothetical protein [Oligoflexia bacterium]